MVPFKDPERKKSFQREWLAAHAERHRQQSRQGVKRWRARRPEEHRAYRREYYAGNAERLRAQIRSWHQAHPLVRRFARARRRAREVNAVGGFGPRDWEALVARYGGRCGYCGAVGSLQPDHRVPLARGGTNAIENIIPACAPCNLRKGKSTEDEFRLRLARDQAGKRGRSR